MVKGVSFKKREKDLIEFIKDKDFSYYVKELIREDMKGKVSTDIPENDIPNRIGKTQNRKRNTHFVV